MHKRLNTEFHFAKAGLRLKNRAVLAPLTHNMSSSNGDPSQDELNWLSRCASGGFGLIIGAATQVWPGGRCWLGQPALMNDAQQQAFSHFAQSAKENGAVALLQLHHGGVRALTELNDEIPVGPSAEQPSPRYPNGVKALDDIEINELIDAFCQAAQRAFDAGLHGVELHGAHNFLLCNFLNPLINRRTDQWGGCLANRARFLIEIIRRIRASLPRQFLIGVRLSPQNYANVVGIELDNQLAVTELLAAEDIDYVHFSMGDTFKDVVGGTDKLLTEISRAINGILPLMVAGKISDAAAANMAIAGGADLVAIGSSALGNPDWVQKVSYDTPLVHPPFAKNQLIELGFTDTAVNYFKTMPGLITGCEDMENV